MSSLLSGHAKAAQFPVSPVSPLYPADLEQTDSVVAFTDALNACEIRPSRTLRLLVNSENSFKVSMGRARSPPHLQLPALPQNRWSCLGKNTPLH